MPADSCCRVVPAVTSEEALSQRRQREQRLAEELPSEADIRLAGPGGAEHRGRVAAAASKVSNAALAVPRQVGGKVAGSMAGGVVNLLWGRVARALGAF